MVSLEWVKEYFCNEVWIILKYRTGEELNLCGYLTLSLVLALVEVSLLPSQ